MRNSIDYVIATSLVVASVVTLWGTADMGFTRDESFYFKYSEVYQGWFTRVNKQLMGENNDALSRKDVVATWGQNFEHPPLMKVLFGWSWKYLSYKHRPITKITAASAHAPASIQVTMASEADDFRVGDTLELLRPLSVGASRDSTDRTIGRGTITAISNRHAQVSIDGITPKALKDICKEPVSTGSTKPHPWIAGCQTKSSGVMSETEAMRLPTWLMSGILLALIYLIGIEFFNRWTGAFAALAFFFVPRHFFHAHLCTFDMAVTTAVMATIYAFWRSLESRKWCVATAIIWGLALLTKLNAFFIPIPLVLWWLATSKPALKRDAGGHRVPQWQNVLLAIITIAAFTWHVWAGLTLVLIGLIVHQRTISITKVPEAFFWMPPIGLAMMFIFWPKLWYDPGQSFADYVNFHMQHVHYLQQYFGNILSVPPFPVAYPFVMTLLTVPVVLLGCLLIGLITMFGTERNSTSGQVRLFIALNMLFPIALIAMPNTPIFGGVKHWFVTMAFASVIMGYGFDWLRRKVISARIATSWIQNTVAIATMLLLLAPGSAASFKYRQFGTSYYNALIGGVRGAADHSMHRQFWGYSGRYALEWVNKNAPRNATIAFHNTTWDAVEWYKREQLLRHDLRWRRDPPSTCTPKSGIYLFHHQESFAQDRLDAWSRSGMYAPEKVISIDGVPMLSIYRCNSGGRAGKT